MLLPIDVSVFGYVYSVKVTETEVPSVFCFANESGGVHSTLSADEYELELPRIQPETLPQTYFNVCVKSAFLLIVRVCAVPSVPLLTVSVDFRGMVSSVPLPDPVIVPTEEPLKVIANS